MSTRRQRDLEAVPQAVKHAIGELVFMAAFVMRGNLRSARLHFEKAQDHQAIIKAALAPLAKAKR